LKKNTPKEMISIDSHCELSIYM